MARSRIIGQNTGQNRSQNGVVAHVARRRPRIITACQTRGPTRRTSRGVVLTTSVNDHSAPRLRVIKDGIAAQLPDIDPEETTEWLNSFDAMVDAGGQQRARYLMLRLLERARQQHVALPALTTTDYINTIPTESEPFF